MESEAHFQAEREARKLRQRYCKDSTVTVVEGEEPNTSRMKLEAAAMSVATARPGARLAPTPTRKR